MTSWRGVSETEIRLQQKVNMQRGSKESKHRTTIVVKHGFKGKETGGGMKRRKKTFECADLF